MKVDVPILDIRDAFFDELHAIAAEDSSVLFLTADMGAFSLEKFKADFPRQFINIGPAEQNLASIAAGLALSGKKVFIYGIASFVSQRCYEQIKIDICAMNLPVVIIGSGPGFAYTSDGITHHATQDISIMRALPKIVIFNPSDHCTASAAAKISYKSNQPFYIRLDKGKFPVLYHKNSDFSQGLALLKKGCDIIIISTGAMVFQAIEIAKDLEKRSISAGVIDLYRVKPLNEELLLAFIKTTSCVVSLEEHFITGGIGSLVSELITDRRISLAFKRIAVPDDKCLVGYGCRDWMHSCYGLDITTVTKIILNWRKELRKTDGTGHKR